MYKRSYGLIAWYKDIRRMRKQQYGTFVRSETLTPMDSPLDMAYYQGWIDGYADRGKRTEQLELF